VGLAGHEHTTSQLHASMLQEGGPANEEARLMTNGGRKIVGPGYSALTRSDTIDTSLGSHAPVTWGAHQSEDYDGMAHRNAPAISQSRESKGAISSEKAMPKPRWCPVSLSKTQRRRLQKLRKKELEEEKEEKAWDEWFNQVSPMTKPKQTWREKRLAREEGSNNENTDQSSVSGSEVVDVSMVFELLTEFRAPDAEVAELVLGAKTTTFQKPKKLGVHMKPLFIMGYL
jgi:hypothetical protein